MIDYRNRKAVILKLKYGDGYVRLVGTEFIGVTGGGLTPQFDFRPPVVLIPIF